MKTVFTFGGPNVFNAGDMIQLRQSEGQSKTFTVVYGKQVKFDLTYAQAAKELGECIMHMLSCDGVIK